MVIEVRYQRAEDAKDPRTHFTETKYFEIDQMPDHKMVAQKLKRMGVDFDEGSILIEACKDNAETMRKGNILVVKF
jgi:hypothetical protein